jgi:hypothetical protein
VAHHLTTNHFSLTIVPPFRSPYPADLTKWYQEKASRLSSSPGLWPQRGAGAKATPLTRKGVEYNDAI